jgi:16S rRNA (cytidine1402-2'-O)-methyltransferase
VFGDRQAAVARELTKMYEECVRGSLPELAAHPRLAEPKGEIVVLVGPGAALDATPEDIDRALVEAMARLSPGEAASEVSKSLDLPRKVLYRRALELQGKA